MVMLGSSSNDNAHARLSRLPGEIGGVQTQTTYLVVPDADAVHARVLAAGVEIPMPIQDQDYGGRGFSCLDPEQHLWHIGSYDPWA